MSLKFKCNLPKAVVCPKIAISIILGTTMKKMKNKLNVVKSTTYSYGIKRGDVLPMTHNHIYQQDGHLASTGIECLNKKAYLR